MRVESSRYHADTRCEYIVYSPKAYVIQACYPEAYGALDCDLEHVPEQARQVMVVEMKQSERICPTTCR